MQQEDKNDYKNGHFLQRENLLGFTWPSDVCTVFTLKLNKLSKVV